MNQNNPKIILLIIVSIAVLAGIGMTTLCLSLFLHTYADPAILTAIITITSAAIGALTSMLVNTSSGKADASVQAPALAAPISVPSMWTPPMQQHPFSVEEPPGAEVPNPKPEPAEPAS